MELPTYSQDVNREEEQQEGNSYTDTNENMSFKLDEGFVDETRSLDDGDSAMGLEPRTGDMSRSLPDPLVALNEAIMSLNEAQRTAHVCRLLHTLNTSSIAAIMDMLYPRLHMDPVRYLPPELTSSIFAYLPPDSLLEASRVSKAWREIIIDTSLWKRKFLNEGWKLDMTEVVRFERELNGRRSSKGGRVRKADESDLEHLSKKRHTLKYEDTASSSTMLSQEDAMMGVESLTMEPTSMLSPTSSMHVEHSPTLHRSTGMEMDLDTTSDAMIVSAARNSAKLNYHHVYRQRRRLEENWTACRYKSFQLPHKDHPEEAHNECVYTIQYSGKYLVSGSRDKTLRIWDLDTQRLVTRPLSGHNGSVLCLQFDASPEEDVIISGSSDTDVIVWQFSTGRLVKRISSAHSESVLNIKFDKRYLVTCSKDKLIKVWNRHALQPGDDAYPIRGISGGAQFPSYILDLSVIQDPRDMEKFFTPEQLGPIVEYSLIMQIELHAAAVNAVHIYKDELVSASGDRDIKVFNIRTGAQTALCKGHHKGIACVQYDGIRIVSGSSDDTIRIFDPKSQAEVGCLKGHTKLVRTVQASFGDVPGDEQELEREARRVDQDWLSAKARGQISTARQSEWRRRRDRNAGSSNPKDVMAVGAHLPPGGGGSKWARIISGSYDETVIIWRKAKDGRWQPQHRLKQAEALIAAGEPLLTSTERIDLAARGAHQMAQQQQQQAVQASTQQRHQQFAMLARQAQQGLGARPPTTANAPIVPVAGSSRAAPVVQSNAGQAAQTAPSLTNAQLPQHPAPLLPPGNITAHQQPPPAHHHHHHHVHHHGHHNGIHPGQQNARVFKLQFDARRIVACSQDPKIVGWDFANGDEEIEQVSRFFAQPG